MKKIINRKMYDTETAKEIACFDNGLGIGNFDHYSETLYKKKTGEFFLHGEGGARTKYAKRCESNSWCGGEDIIPLTENEAMDWMERYCSADEFITAFGNVKE